jgi:retron-type reverse transcriptase
VILKLIHQNRYGFLKGRTIQDCIIWAFEYLHWCHQSNKEFVIIKLDFEKAFDTIEHQLIIDMLKFTGFGPIWLKWISNILSTGTSSMLLNGVSG